MCKLWHFEHVTQVLHHSICDGSAAHAATINGDVQIDPAWVYCHQCSDYIYIPTSKLSMARWKHCKIHLVKSAVANVCKPWGTQRHHGSSSADAICYKVPMETDKMCSVLQHSCMAHSLGRCLLEASHPMQPMCLLV